MAEIDKPQAFRECHRNYELEPHLMEIIFDWARRLPPSPQGVIDLAAGFGVEVKELLSAGIPCIGQDCSKDMVQHACTPINQGTAEDLSQYPDNQFNGALLKDTLIVLSPNQRVKMLTEVRRILVPQGSLLIRSEIQLQHEVGYYQTRVLFRNQPNLKIISRSFKNFQEKVVTYQGKYSFGLFKFISTPEDTQELAETHGFSFQLLCRFDRKNSLAKEARWTQRASFIAVLTKKD